MLVQPQRVQPPSWPTCARRELLAPLLVGCLASVTSPEPALASTSTTNSLQASAPTTNSFLNPSAAAATVTDRVFLDIRIIQRYDVEVLEDAAIRGRLTFNLFGKDAPRGTRKFLDFVDGTVGQFARSGGGPAYSSGSFDRLRPSIQIEGGRIAGLRTTSFQGQQEYEYLGRLLPLRPVLEVNEVRHDRRGLLTRPIFAPGPEFGITLAPAPSLDGSNEVIGQLDPRDTGNLQLLAMLENLPYITGTSMEGEGTAANAVFQAQKSFFSTLSKTVGDSRAEDRTGALLRRVEITKCGRL